MKVLHVIPGIAPRYGGPSRAALEMGRALQEQGVEVLIATTDANGPRRLPVSIGQVVEYRGVSVIFFPRQWSEAFKFSYPLAQWLKQNVARFNVVHIHAVFSHSSLAAAAACRRVGVPYVLRPLGSLDPWCLNQKRWRKRILWYLGVKRMIAEAAAMHYTTGAEQELAEASLARWGYGDGASHPVSVVIPHGVSAELLESREVSAPVRRHWGVGEDPFVLILGRLHPKKGIDLFLDVFAEVIQRDGLSHWRLVLAGEGPATYVGGLKRRAQENGLQDRVHFVGWLEGEWKVAALREAALLALPSYQENFGLSAVEAMACGMPVLVSDHVNLAPEVQAAGAGWVSPLTREGLARTLAEALQDERERRARGVRARILVQEKFTWPAVARQLVGLYASISQQ